MRALLTGATGQVGAALARTKPELVELIALSHAELDICDPERVDAELRARRPDILINAAAYTAVDRAESEQERARAVNEEGPRNLATAAAAVGARVIHLSTDYVFDGESTRAYEPDDATAPLNAYGRTKLAGEAAVLTAAPGRSLILRTAWVYGAQGQNFVRTMLRIMQQRGEARVVADQIGTPTAAPSIAHVVWELAARPELHGVYHWTDAGVASWYDFATAIAEEAARLRYLDREVAVHPISTAEYPTAARRPRFSLLNTRATSSALGVKPYHWRVWLRRVLEDMQHA